MTMALVLIDADNVVDPSDGLADAFEDAAEVLSRIAGSMSIERVTTAVALNTDTGVLYELTWDALSDGSRALAKAAAADEAPLEIAITLEMPQAADVLLGRLARNAPLDEPATYGSLLLVSKDKGLRSDLEQEVLGAGAVPWVSRGKGRLGLAYGWTRPPNGVAVRRKPVARPKTQPAQPMNLTASYTEVVERPDHAEWAGTRGFDAQQPSLFALCQEIRQEPWLLSQVGATNKSLRGIARLDRWRKDPTASLGAICPKRDGVELRGGAARPTSVTRLAKASVGIGAARSNQQAATIACVLPVAALEAASSVPVVGAGVQLDEVLRALPVGDPLNAYAKPVSLWSRGATLVAKVKHGFDKQPALWWLLGRSSPKSERRVEGAGHLLSAPIETTAVAYRPGHDCGCRLAFRIPLEATELRTLEPIARGQIGPAVLEREHGKPLPVAVLALRAPLGPRERVSVTPIHEAPSHLLRLYDSALLGLPVAVPR